MEARCPLEVVRDARLVLRLQRRIEFFVLADEPPEVVDAKDVGALQQVVEFVDISEEVVVNI